MKKIISLLGLAIAAGMIFSSCTKEEEAKLAETPLKSITVKNGGETAAGVVNDTDKTVLFVFDESESFSNVDLIVELNEGWTLTFPTTLTGVNLQDTPVFNFEDPSGQRVRYTITFSSNAFPIVDASKIQIKGLQAGENISVDNATKVITVVYDQDKIDYNNVEIIFNEGALQNGVVLPSDLAYDFTDGISQPLVLDLNGERPYTLTLDVSAYRKKSLSEMGFTDLTSEFVTPADYPYLNVYKGTVFPNLPVWEIGNVWTPSNPRSWEYWIEQEPGEPYPYTHDVFSMVGNWTEDRPTMTAFGTLAIITIDQDKVAGEIIPNVDYSKKFGEVEGLVTIMGCKKAGSIDYMIYDNSSVVNEGAGCYSAYRNSFGFNADGKLSFAVAARKGNELYQVPFQTEWLPLGPDNFSPAEGSAEAVAETATEKWNVTDAAWAYGWLIRDGKALTIQDVIKNDGTNYVSDGGVLGLGWNSFYMKRVLMGRTYDNKIAIMVSSGGQDCWDSGYDVYDNVYNVLRESWGYYFGVNTAQMVWIANQLGWRDVALVSTGDDEGDTSIMPNVRINGKAVITQTEATYNPDIYANESADMVASYYVSLKTK